MPSYLDKEYVYIAVSSNFGETIKFFPVKNHHRAESNLIECRKYYNRMIAIEGEI
jgi:hypothetical protein